jgi:hypothetical protein
MEEAIRLTNDKIRGRALFGVLCRELYDPIIRAGGKTETFYSIRSIYHDISCMVLHADRFPDQSVGPRGWLTLSKLSSLNFGSVLDWHGYSRDL